MVLHSAGGLEVFDQLLDSFLVLDLLRLEGK
jgi:hypothetical protein